jgi:hypothetical protein
LLLNDCETRLDFKLRATPEDFVKVFANDTEIAEVTGKENMTVEGRSGPFFVVITISNEILARRSLSLKIETQNCTEQDRVLFLGPYDPGFPSLPPMVDPVVEKEQFEPAYVFGFLMVAICLGTVLAWSCFRYRWTDAVAATCKKEVPPSPAGTSWSASSRSPVRINLIGIHV